MIARSCGFVQVQMVLLLFHLTPARFAAKLRSIVFPGDASCMKTGGARSGHRVSGGIGQPGTAVAFAAREGAACWACEPCRGRAKLPGPVRAQITNLPYSGPAPARLRDWNVLVASKARFVARFSELFSPPAPPGPSISNRADFSCCVCVVIAGSARVKRCCNVHTGSCNWFIPQIPLRWPAFAGHFF